MARLSLPWLVLVGAASACSPQGKAARPPEPPAVVTDAAATPPAAAAAPSEACHDFYAFACRDWLDAHPIPPDASSWSLYDEVTKKNRALVQEILDESARGGIAGPHADVATRVGTYYAACLDEQTIETRGISPMASDLAAVAAISTRKQLILVLASLQKRGMRPVIDLSAEQDLKDATRVIAGADRAILSLRVKDNYLASDDHAKSLRAAYVEYLVRIFGLLGGTKEAATADAQRVLDLETELARSGRDEVLRRDPKKRHNPVIVAEPKKGAFDWRGYLALVGAKGVTTLNVYDPEYFDGLTRLLASADLATWRAYLRARLIRSMHVLLPAAFVRADFDFFQRTLRGTKEMAPRWKRCADMVDRDIGEALGQLFAERAFPEANKAKVLRLVEAVRESLRVDLSSATWLSEPTRRAALAKLAAVKVKVGYPDQFRDYSSIHLERDDAFGNAQRATTFEFQRQLHKIGRPVERDEWFELPQSLDAYGSNQLNEVVFTAGFLQPPLFDPSADEATMFGSLGAVIGHELTHRFDDSGRNFDADGNLRDWWTAEDAKEYATRAACFTAQYAGYTVAGEHLDGKLTLGENIADNGGLRLAHRAAHVEPGSEAEQKLFMAWGRIRCANVTEETARTRLRGDPHSPGRYRAIGAVVNMPEFQQAFSCPADALMRNEPACRLW